MIEVFVESIRVNMTNYKRVVMLKEKAGDRYLPIWIGHFEADAIAIPMQKVPVNRPLTHDLLTSAIPSLGGTVTQAVISELSNETFFAKVIVDHSGRHVELDSRPSDAIAVAIRAKVPIYVEDAIMAKAGMTFDADAPTPARPDSGTSTVESLLESALGSAAEDQPTAEEPPAADADEAPYLPSAEPRDGRPAEPFRRTGPVSQPVLAALQRAVASAKRSRRDWIGPGDLMLGLLRERRAAANGVLRALSVEPDELQTLIEREIERDRPAVMPTPAARAATQRAREEATRLEERSVGSEHLLLALGGQSESSVTVALDRLGVSAEGIRRQIAVLLTPTDPPTSEEREADDAG
jgi:bifunctional DNase/RNase